MLGAYLAALAVIPVVLFMILGAAWTQQGHTFARYVFPVQVIYLIWTSIGFSELVRAASHGARPGLELALAALAAVGYLAVNPAIRQVATLGPWYGHLYHHFDYVRMHNVAELAYIAYEPPPFYRRLAAMAPGGVTLVRGPFAGGDLTTWHSSRVSSARDHRTAPRPLPGCDERYCFSFDLVLLMQVSVAVLEGRAFHCFP